VEFVDLHLQDPKTRTYLGSPSLLCLPDGSLLATHDYFGPGCPLNHEGEEHLTSVYRSEDGGATWQNITHIAGAFWSTLFLHAGNVYLIGTSAQYGSVVIRRSMDGGFTWTHPASRESGKLLLGGPGRVPPNFHCAPVPVVEHQGRLYRAFENFHPTTGNNQWSAPDFLSFVLSCPVDADLLDARAWTISNALRFDPAWLPPAWSEMTAPGWLEGNIVVDPDGRVVNILRIHSDPLWDKAALLHVSDGGREVWFDPADGWLDFPGGKSKFSLRFDHETGYYLTLSNANPDPARPSNRSVLSWHASKDLRTWHNLGVLLQDDGSVPNELVQQQVGFQYVDWQIDGDDILYLARTAYDGAHNYHDSNRITFHRLDNFRQKLGGQR